MKEINCILGTGMTAKIFAFYNREFKIIGKNVSLVADPILSNMIFLQDNVYNRMFLQDLQDISKEKIAFCYKNIDVLTFDGQDYSNIMFEYDKRKVIDKKLTAVDGKKLEFKSSVFEENLKLSEERNSILKIIEVNFNDITKALDKVVGDQIIDNSEMLVIDLKIKTFSTEKATYVYKTLVNTLSLDKFSKLTGEDFGDLSTLDTTTIEGTEEMFGVPKIPYQDAIVYFPQDEFEFGKMVKRNGRVFAEITGTSQKFKGGSVTKGARLIKKSIIKSFPGLIHVGRHSNWNPDIRIQDVVRQASNKFAMQNIFLEQKDFSSKFFCFEEDLKIIQDNIKEASMLMMQENFDLLNCINWKKHSTEKKLNLEEIKSELIDVFNYWLIMGLSLGLTFEDFLEAHKKKQDKLNLKLLTNDKR